MTDQKDQADQLHAMRHSLAHIMAAAVRHLWPEAKFGVGPAVEHGFYYDIDLGDTKISQEDFAKIEAEMRKIIKENQEFERFELPVDEAVAWAKDNDQPYKEELLNDLRRAGTTAAKDLDAAELGTISEGDAKVDDVSFYRNGDFTDLCRGPHVASTGKTGAFKLMRVAGAYWRGNEKNPQMQRLYGAAFATDKELRQHLALLEEAKKRDHRRLGQELDLFIISDLVGPGLPIFTPRGTVLRQELVRFSEELQRTAGYEAVWAPHITKTELYKVSGHLEKYPERFDVTSVESTDKFMMKPMNCPHVTQIFASRPRSYRDMPQRYMETTTLYRDEKSGELHGLSRVRSLTQDDSHAFVRPDQIEAEMRSILEMVKQMYLTLDMPLSVDLSFRDDSDNYFGDPGLWEKAQEILGRVAEEAELDYKVEQGEAAFYGPKIDIYVSDALGRRWQCATVQLDFVMPERFGLEYTDEAGKAQRPAMIHKAILGSIERFLSVYIEHTAGKFPIWLAPEQVRIISVNQEKRTIDFAREVEDYARGLGLRVHVDNANESVGKKIRAAEVAKVPYSVVIGEKEVGTRQLVPRIRKDIAVIDAPVSLGFEEFLKTVANEAKGRVLKTSL
ncbi:MAG TPA: threonine--tRNA ligase [Candidatus Saccharimonadales bacterium]|nr:threonine--tRNA ligase [Candidatus Saccharimonadales bacterium]